MSKGNPIGQGTVNRTVNLTSELDAMMGREAYARGYKSKSDFIRRAILREIANSSRKAGAAGILFLAGLLGAEAVFSNHAVRRPQRNRVVRIVRSHRLPRKEVSLWIA